MKKIACFLSCCFVVLELFCAPEREISYLSAIENITATLSVGEELDEEQERFLFPEESSGTFGRFLALNYRDKRVWRLRELILSSNFSKRRKEYIAGMLSREGRMGALQWICYNGLELPPVLSEEDWDERFQPKDVPLSKDEQFATIRRFADAGEKFSAALKSERGRDVDFILPYFWEVIRLRGEVFELRSPVSKAERAEVAELFIAVSDSLREAFELADEYFFSKGTNLYLLGEIDVNQLFCADSYILDYALLKEREKVLRRRREREKGNVAAP
ncbi:MAG: hypothetical protein IJN19_07045 [Opitutales bacterium]|nr:hypothetical protein [Opitutales bacterium]